MAVEPQVSVGDGCDPPIIVVGDGRFYPTWHPMFWLGVLFDLQVW